MSDPVRDDLRNFVYLVWQHLNLPQPTPVQYDIASYLQHGPKRRMVKAFRGVGKSWITASYVIWLLYRDPQERVLVVSASKDRADAFSIFVKRLITEMPLLHHLKPRQGQRDSNIAFDVGPARAHQAPSTRSVGITGQLTGGRATTIVADDVESPANALTDTQRQRLAEAVKEFDAVLVPNGQVIYLGTSQSDQSLYERLPERGYDMRIWPARYPKQDQLPLYGRFLAPMIADAVAADPSLGTRLSGRGVPTEPTRFTDTDLIEREASYGRSGFALQFMLLPHLADQDRYPLKLSDLVVFDCNPELAPSRIVWASGPDQIVQDLPSVGFAGDRWHRPMFVPEKDFLPYQQVILAVDPAGRGGDELAYCVLGLLNGYLYLLQLRGLTGGYSDKNLELLATEAKKFGAKRVIVESNFGDGMFSKLLQPHLTRVYPCTIEEVRSSGQKERRIIDVLEPVMNQHRLVVDRKVIREDAENYNGYALEHAHKYQAFYQMTRITRDRGSLAKDDRIDVLAIGVGFLKELLSRDVANLEEQRKAELLEEELRKMRENILGGVSRQGWLGHQRFANRGYA